MSPSANGWLWFTLPGVVFCLITVLAGSVASAQDCVGDPVAVQILGSGGPGIKADRASTGYLLCVEEQAKLLVDMGGALFCALDRRRQSSALLWLSQGIRQEPLLISGPSGNDQAPDFPVFLSRLFDENNGGFPLLGSALGGGQGRVRPGVPSVHLDVRVVDVAKPEPTMVLNRAGITVTALGIPYDDVPTLAFRVQTRNVSTVFSSDQNGTNPRFTAFAKGANVLIMHMTIGAGTPGNTFHAAPPVIGRIARDAAVGRLIVSHIGQDCSYNVGNPETGEEVKKCVTFCQHPYLYLYRPS